MAGYGDEVIIPSYTYSATALSILNLGAKPVMVDVLGDFTLDPSKIEKAVTKKTKAIMPVDIGGWPCDYCSINKLVKSKKINSLFVPKTEKQKKLNRILVIADAAHSIGAKYNNMPVGKLCDITIFFISLVKILLLPRGSNLFKSTKRF